MLVFVQSTAVNETNVHPAVSPCRFPMHTKEIIAKNQLNLSTHFPTGLTDESKCQFCLHMPGMGWLDNAKLHGFHWERFNPLVYSLCAELHVCSNSINSQQIVTAEALNLKHKAFVFCKQHYGNDLEIAAFFFSNLHSTHSIL